MGRNRQSELTRGKGYWLELNIQKHMRKQEAFASLTCVMCGRSIVAGAKYVYVIPTKDCIHLSGCLSMYPRSVWVGEKVESNPKRSEEEVLLDTAVCEVVVEGRSVEEVAEEFDLEVETLQRRCGHAKSDVSMYNVDKHV